MCKKYIVCVCVCLFCVCTFRGNTFVFCFVTMLKEPLQVLSGKVINLKSYQTNEYHLFEIPLLSPTCEIDDFPLCSLCI